MLGYTEQEATSFMAEQVVPDPSGPRAIQTSRQARNKYKAKMWKRKNNYEQKRSKL